MAQTKPKKKSTANKRSTSKSTAKKKTTPKSKSSKPNNGKSRARTYSDTPKTKTRELTKDDFITREDLRKVGEGFRKAKADMGSVAAQFNRGWKKRSDEHKAKKKSKREEKSKKKIESYNAKLNLDRDEYGNIDTRDDEPQSDIVKVESSPLDRTERMKKKKKLATLLSSVSDLW